MKRVRFDHCVPRPFRNELTGCMVSTAVEMGWAQLKNGELLDSEGSVLLHRAQIDIQGSFVHPLGKKQMSSRGAQIPLV